MKFFSNPIPKTLATALLSSFLFGCADRAIYYVAPQGDDRNAGTESSPFATLEGARDYLRQSGELGTKPIEVIVRPGVYYLPETLIFEAIDSGSEKNSVSYRAEIEGEAVLSGGSRLELEWGEYGDGIYQANTPKGLLIDQLFIDGKRQHMARYPNYDPSKKAQAYQGYAADAFSKERAARWKDPEGGYIHAMHKSRWGGYHYRITGKNADGEVIYEGGWQNNRQMGMHDEFRIVENIFEELDAEGEWFHDSEKGILFYKPVPGTDLDAAVVEVVRLRHLVEFQGSEAEPVEHISLQGFVLRHAARTFMDTKEPLLRSDWTIYRGGAFMLTGTEDVSILDCEFDQVGGNAIFVNMYNRGTLVQGCHIHDVGASGVCFVGDPGAVRDPLFEYAEKNDLSKIDRTVGPKTNNYPADGVVEDCLIHGVGTVERQPAGVQISMSMGITVRDTSIYDTARAGINVSEGTWGGHLIERCDVFDTVLETHDHGSFNSWGRDRFWRSDHLTATQAAVDEDPELPFLDAMKTTVIRDSRWRCDHGWDIDLDDGSSNYEIYNNLMLRGGLKFREGFRRRAWNNITVNNGFHPHVWFRNSGDEVFSNIFMIPHQEIRVGFGGKRVDGNIFHSNDPSITEYDEAWNWENNALVAELEFVDPAKGDFRLKEGSPAFDYGFENFPMDQFGVKKPSLKAIARTPVIPPLNMVSAEGGGEAVDAFWKGGRIHSLVGEEFSAYGVSKEEGGIAILDAPAGSVLAENELVAGDLIQKVNGEQVSTLAAFFEAVERAGDKRLELLIVRNQEMKVVVFDG